MIHTFAIAVDAWWTAGGSFVGGSTVAGASTAGLGASTAGAGLFVPLLEEVWASSMAGRLAVAAFLKRLNGAIVAVLVVSVTGDGEEDGDGEAWVRETRVQRTVRGQGQFRDEG